MGAFLAIVGGVLAGMIFCIVYISLRTAHFPVMQKLGGGRRWLAFLLSLIVYLVICFVLQRIINMVNTAIVLVHVGALWLIWELIFFLLKKVMHKNFPDYLPGVCALVFSVCYLLTAWYLCSHVWEKDYHLESSRLNGNLRIVQFADSHIGTTFHADGLRGYVRKINALEPDLVVITGDFVDDDTSLKDMTGSCKALGELETKYGVYFSFGNHDKGYYNAERRGWDVHDLLKNLEKNGVMILRDDVLLVDDRFYIIGRKDRSEGDRMASGTLMEGLDPDLYRIVLDHQPCEYDEAAEAGADLVLSGHTHGGQFFPFNNIGVLTKQYERSYGHEKRGDTDFIVTSGISDWSLIFKTGCRSEYVVIDVNTVPES